MLDWSQTGQSKAKPRTKQNKVVPLCHFDDVCHGKEGEKGKPEKHTRRRDAGWMDG